MAVLSFNRPAAAMRTVGPWAAAAVVLALPLAAERGTLDLLVFAAIYAIGGLGVGIALGQGGIINLAQTVFYAVGAYSVALCSTRWGLPSLAGFPLGMLVAAVLALALGWPILRLQGYYLALATLALSLMAGALFLEWDGLTGGTLGIGGIEPLRLAGMALTQPVHFYYLAWAVAGACVLLAHNLVGARPGLAMRAMRSSTDAARALGIDTQDLRVRVFVLSAVLGSLAGALFAAYTGFVSVQSFTVERSISFLLVPVLGGARRPLGTVLGALFVVFVPEALSSLGDVHQVLFGLALVFVVIALPDGLSGWLARRGMKETTR